LAVKAAELYAEIGANVTGFRAGTQEASRGMSALRSQVENDTRAVSSFFADMVKFEVVKQAFSGLVSLIRGVGSEALSAVSALEALTFSANTMIAVELKNADATQDMAQALAMAREPAAALVQWMQDLARFSPLTTESVASMVQLVQTAGFSTAEVKRLTTALVDFTSATGRGGETGKRIALSLSQMAAAGKVTGMELRELANAGMPALRVLASGFGVTEAAMKGMIEDGAVPAGKALEVLTSWMENNFAGTAKRMTETWAGMTSSLSDIKTQDLQALFGGIFGAVQPEIAKAVNLLGSAEFKTALKQAGDEIGAALSSGIRQFKEQLATLDDLGVFDGLKEAWAQLTAGSEGATAASVVRDIVTALGMAAVGTRTLGDLTGAVFSYMGEAAQRFAANAVQQFQYLLKAGIELLRIFDMIGQVFGTLAKLNPTNPAQLMAGLNELGGLRGKIDAINESWGDLTGVIAESTATADTYRAREANELQAQGLKLQSIMERKEREIAAIQEVDKAYEDAEKRRENRKLVLAAEDPDVDRLRASDRKVVQDIKEGLQTSEILNANTWGKNGAVAGDKAGEAFAKKAAGILESAIDAIRNPIQSAINDAKKLIPGYKEPGAPGTNQWAEDIYRIIDVAQNLGTPHEGQDTRKWYQKFYDGMGFDEARNLAKGTQDAFIAGDLMAPNVRQYLDDAKLRALLQQNAKGGGSIDEYARMIGTDSATLAAVLKSGGKASDAEIAALTKGGLPAAAKKSDAAVVTAAAKGGADVGLPAPKEAIKGLLDDFDKEIVAAAEATKGKGAAFWKTFEDGLLDAANNSGALWNAVKAMVTIALAKQIPA
jgi:tape measure domain-containing protein